MIDNKPEVKPVKGIIPTETPEQKQARINQCTAQINKVLADNNCEMGCYFILTSKGNTPVIQVLSK